MYCVKCGVALADTERVCPLCRTRVCHPDFPLPEVMPLYPENASPKKEVNRWSIMLIVTILFLLPMSICLVADISVNGRMDWSGYVTGALLVFYTAFFLPNWFHRPNPVIFVPVTFGVIAGYLLYINLFTDGDWFLVFALPITAAFCLILTAVVTLCRYIRRGRLYIFGGAVIALGAFTVLLEALLHIAFGLPGLGSWSPYPLCALTLLGLAMIVTAIFRPLREALEKKFFL